MGEGCHVLRRGEADWFSAKGWPTKVVLRIEHATRYRLEYAQALVVPAQSSSAQSTGVAPSRRVQTSGARLTR